LPRSLSPKAETARNPAPLAIDRSHRRAIVAALDLAGKARRPRGSDRIATQLLHAIVQAIDPPSSVRATAGGALPDPHEIRVTRIEATDVCLQLTSEARWQVHDHVEMLASFGRVVLPRPDPMGADPPAATPCGDARSQADEEVVQIALGIGIEMDRMEVQGRLERASYHSGEAVSPSQALPLLSCDALRPCLAALVPLRLDAALPSLLALRGASLFGRA
jgi:hypothetical protein